jgi:hypothetical protein
MLLSCSTVLQAQNNPPLNEPDPNRPTLFDNLPDRIPVNISRITTLIGRSVGSTISMDMSDNMSLRIDGEVVSSASNFENKLESVVIRSSNFNGAAFTISKITDKDGNVSYSGRIVSLKHGDLFELKNEEGNYTLIKRKFYDLVNE